MLFLVESVSVAIVMTAVLFILAYAFTGGFCQERIWGGSPTEIDEWPWVVSLLTRDDETTTEAGAWKLRCGGVIITKSHVLTSAWCLKVIVEKELPTKDVIVRGNTEYWSCACGRKRDHTIASYVIHERYKEQSPFKRTPFFENDIGIVTVENPFSGLYEMPKSYTDASRFWQSGEKSTAIVGWGYWNRSEIVQDQLNHGRINIYDQIYCEEIYGKRLPPFTYCAAFEGNEKKWGPCEYDTGGPQFGVRGIELILIGIVSTGDGCIKKPAVFTNISHFVPWINRKVGEDSNPDYNWNSPYY